MTLRAKKIRQVEFGDFQTPKVLAEQVCELLAARGLKPASIIEPTAGVGAFLFAALERFKPVRLAVGLDINQEYVDHIRRELSGKPYAAKVRLIRSNFFETDWPAILRDLPEPILAIGNLPWVTNAALGSMGSSNLPVKSNFQNHRGMDAITGKSNFDISEWMMVRILEWFRGREAASAFLCKTAVARKVLVYAWRNGIQLARADIYRIPALAHFGAAVDACLLVCGLSSSTNHDCSVYSDLEATKPISTIGYRNRRLVADTGLYERWRHLEGSGTYQWRSGIKHDCASILELQKVGSRYKNGLGENVDLEDDCVYPMLKSSEIANGARRSPNRWMLVTQRSVGDDTDSIESIAPKTWRYLCRHARLLDARGSTIYKNRPRFSIFGVGQYSFAPWKVAISGFYKKFAFKAVGSFDGKPVVLDDTSYFLACASEEEARCIASLLNSEIAKEFYGAFVFWDAKRPITVELLKRLDLVALARVLNVPTTSLVSPSRQLLMSSSASSSTSRQGRPIE